MVAPAADASPPGETGNSGAPVLPLATLRITVDNAVEDLVVNDQVLRLEPESATDWTKGSTVNFEVRPGKNVIAIKAIDKGVIAGLLAELQVGPSVLVSGEAWKVALVAPEAWSTAAFDDSTWASATPYAPYGEGVWATRVAGLEGLSADASWIWTATNELNGAIDATAYFRFTFEVELAWTASPGS